MSCVFKIANGANGGNDRRCRERADGRDRGQNLALPALLNDLANFSFELFEMILQESKFLNEQSLLYNQAVLSRRVFRPNAHRRQLLDPKELCF